jgi:LysR family hydrogen peroxide-inducible transcriptional activator
MEMHQLKYFLAIADTGNFTRAAEQCHVSQPSLSQQIIKLEEEVGHKLFDRMGRRVQLTDAGRLLEDHARAVLTTVENATRQLRESRGQGFGRLAIGVIPTIAPYLLPQALAVFMRASPNVELIIQEDYTARVIDGLCAGELDVAIAALPIDDENLVVEVLGSEPLLLVLPKGHPLTGKRRILLRDISGEPFVLISEVHCLGEQVMSICRSQEINPRIVCRGAQISTVQAMVALGQGISLLPAMARQGDTDSRRVYQTLATDQPERTIVAVQHRHRFQTTQARQFIEILKRSLG